MRFTRRFLAKAAQECRKDEGAALRGKHARKRFIARHPTSMFLFGSGFGRKSQSARRGAESMETGRSVSFSAQHEQNSTVCIPIAGQNRIELIMRSQARSGIMAFRPGCRRAQ
jgi:hypothetical protein